jgi:hypothetical protein
MPHLDSVIVADLGIAVITVDEPKADAPLVIDGDRVLPLYPVT